MWLATDQVLNRTVAVKILHPRLSVDDSFRERFQLEALAAAKLVHPNIVALYDTGEVENLLFVVMEHARTNLRALLDSGARYAKGGLDVARLGADACSGLAYAHSQGSIHSDLKPSNILLFDGPGPPGLDVNKIGDFGLGRTTAHSASTIATSKLTTLEYLSPEQVAGEPVGARSDIYSLGCVLYEAICGRPPFPGGDFTAAAARVETEPTPVIKISPQTPLPLSQIVMRALERDPDARFADADEMRRALIDVYEHYASANPGRVEHHVAATPFRSAEPTSFVRAEGRWLATAVLVVLAAGALVLGVVRYGERVVESVRQTLSGAGSANTQVAIQAAFVYDPRGDEDSSTKEPGNASDADPKTTWETQHYRTSDFGRLKEGVGISFDLGEVREVRRIEVVTSNPGWRAAIRHSDDGKTWSQPGASSLVDSDHEFTVSGRYRYWMIWITELSETSEDGENPFSASIGEVQVYAD